MTVQGLKDFMNMNGTEIVKSRTADELIEEIQELPPEEKARLVTKILGERAGVNIIFGNGGNHVKKADLVVQINNADKDVLERITQAIARRIER